MKKSLFILCLSCMLLLCACASPLDSFEKQVRDNSYYNAIDIYNTKILGNSQLESSANHFINSFLSEKVEEYANGSITTADFENSYKTVKKVQEQFGIPNNMEEDYALFLSIQTSKKAYEDAMSYYKSGDIIEALFYFDLVIAEDKENYLDAKNTITEIETTCHDNTIQRVNACLEDGNYDAALTELGETVELFGYTEEYESLFSDIYLRKYSEAIKTAYEDGDYQSVFRYYSFALSNEYCIITDQMYQQYSDSKAAYLDSLFSTSESAFGTNKDFSSAINILEDAYSSVSFDETVSNEILQKIEYYERYTPISLSSLKYEQIGDCIDVGGQNNTNGMNPSYAIDVNETQYNDKTVIYPKPLIKYGSASRSYDEEDGTITYQLDSKYSTLQGIIYRPYITLFCTKDWKEDNICRPVVKIYGNDKLLYEAPEITQDTYDTICFSVDISDVSILKIVVLGTFNTRQGALSRIIDPTVCLAELTVQK